jgi:hypothetical protein
MEDQFDLKDLYREMVNIRRELQQFRSSGVLIKTPEDLRKEREE